MAAWTSLRFEFDFTNAFAVGAVAGVGGIGFELNKAGNHYCDLYELGLITYAIVIAVILLEMIVTRVKATLRRPK